MQEFDLLTKSSDTGGSRVSLAALSLGAHILSIILLCPLYCVSFLSSGLSLHSHKIAGVPSIISPQDSDQSRRQE